MHDAVQPDLDPVLPNRVQAELGAAEAREVRKCELDGTAEHVRILILVCDVVLWTRECGERVYECGVASHLHLHDRLDLGDEDLGAGRLLVCHLERNECLDGPVSAHSSPCLPRARSCSTRAAGTLVGISPGHAQPKHGDR